MTVARYYDYEGHMSDQQTFAGLAWKGRGDAAGALFGGDQRDHSVEKARGADRAALPEGGKGTAAASSVLEGSKPQGGSRRGGSLPSEPARPREQATDRLSEGDQADALAKAS